MSPGTCACRRGKERKYRFLPAPCRKESCCKGVPFPSGTVPERKLPHNAWGMVGMSEGKLLQSVWRIGEGCTVCFRQGAGRNVAAKCLGHGGARPDGCTDTVPEQKLLQGILAW